MGHSKGMQKIRDWDGPSLSRGGDKDTGEVFVAFPSIQRSLIRDHSPAPSARRGKMSILERSQGQQFPSQGHGHRPGMMERPLFPKNAP